MKNEFEIIETLARKRPSVLPKELLTDIGDDGAVIRQNSANDLVVTTDLLVEDVDFRREWFVPRLLGGKALAVSLSDAAAMGAKPLWSVTSIGLPKDVWQTDFVERFYEGWNETALKFGVTLVGGDISQTPDKIVVDSTVFGDVPHERAVTRSGAQNGDFIYVTGSLGGASGGLDLLESGLRFDAENAESPAQKLILRQLKPSPRVTEGLILRENDLATAMIDISDGLSSDLRHLCTASAVGARIFADLLPFDENLKNLEKDSARILKKALHGGEDFELLFTVKPSNAEKIEKLLPSAARIGEITAKSILLVTNDGEKDLTARGFRHF